MTDQHLGDVTGAMSYKVDISFTDAFEPSELSGHGLPFVSVETEIEANSNQPIATELRQKYGRIPYGSPIYIWESLAAGKNAVEYVGQTMRLQIQKRFEGHASVVKLLGDHVNRPDTKVYFRLCQRLDLSYEVDGKLKRHAIEHFPLDQARKIVDDIEAYLIYCTKPKYNTHFKNAEKKYFIPFSIQTATNIDLSSTVQQGHAG